MKKYTKYKKDLEYSYATGPFPTYELIENKADIVEKVLTSEDLNSIEKLINILKEKKIPYTISSRQVNKISLKDKEYVTGIFRKEKSNFQEKNHITLDGIDNTGNLGTIMRSMLAPGCKDLAPISNTCDVYNPKVARASMGAFFKLNIQKFDNLKDYKKDFPNNKIYSSLLDESPNELRDAKFDEPFSLVFGNEGTGLPQEHYNENKIFINQPKDVDSLNLPIACSIVMYESKVT